MMQWIKSHKLLTAGLVLGAVVLYWLYKRMKASASSDNSVANIPAYPTVIYGGGGGSAGASSQGSNQAPVASAAAIAVTPGANPAPVVSAPATHDVSSASVATPQAAAPSMPRSTEAARASLASGLFGGSGSGVSWSGGNYDASGNIVSYQRAAPGTPEYALTQGGWIAPSAPSTPVASPSGLLPYQLYLQNQQAAAGPSAPSLGTSWTTLRP